MKEIHLNKLQKGLPGVTPAIGGYLYEAAVVALVLQGHQSGVHIQIEGAFREKFELKWTPEPASSVVQMWQNPKEAAAYGAVGISLLLMTELTDFAFFELGQIGTGIDYWLSTSTQPAKGAFFPVREARLEVSGISKETPSNTINMRVNVKKKQTKPSDNTGLPAWISVIEFSHPTSKIVKK